MFIQTQDTPNPETLKFLPGRVVAMDGNLSLSSVQEASCSPLARQLFELSGVQQVFLGSDFISVTKTSDVSWQTLRPLILAALMDHFLSNRPSVETHTAPILGHTPTDDPIALEIQELLDSRIRPAVALDGGDIVFDRFEEGIVYVRLQGACSGCPSSTATLKSGIENMLRHYVPEVQEVRAV